jgi:hypothetical protein
MGRPLNKKFFGNRNIGSTSTTADNGIGGQGVASVTLNALGSYTTRPTITFAVPTLPDGVRATGTITSEALSAVATAAGTGYEVGDLLTVTTAGGSAIAYVASVDTGGEVLTVNFTGTGASRGSFEALPSGAQATVTDGEGDDACTLTITFRAKAVVITEAGSGYASAPTPTFTQSVSATSVNMTVDSGAPSSATNQENAISGQAFITGGSAKVYDIIKQEASKRYLVKTADGRAQCKLVTTAPLAAGQMHIIATDANGSTYYVRKLTARRAVLVQKEESGSFAFENNSVAGWTLNSASAGIVSIANS